MLSEGRLWCVDLDFKSYFDTIPHEPLLGLVQQRVVDGSVLTLLAQSLKAGVLEELKGKGKKQETVTHTLPFSTIKTTKIQIKF